MSGVQVGNDGKVRAKNDGIVVASEGDPCCCEGPSTCESCGDCCFSTNSKVLVDYIYEEAILQPCPPYEYAVETRTIKGTLSYDANCEWRGALTDKLTGSLCGNNYEEAWNANNYLLCLQAVLGWQMPGPGGGWWTSSGSQTENCCEYSDNQDTTFEDPGIFGPVNLQRRLTLTVQNNKCCRCSPFGPGTYAECTATSDDSVSTCDDDVVNVCSGAQDDDCAMP